MVNVEHAAWLDVPKGGFVEILAGTAEDAAAMGF
jgi:hypothetical protein